MAEIPIQEKRGGSKLPLILGVLALLAVLAWWLTRDRADDTVRTDTAAATTVPADTVGGTGIAPAPSDTARRIDSSTTTGTATGTSTRP